MMIKIFRVQEADGSFREITASEGFVKARYSVYEYVRDDESSISRSISKADFFDLFTDEEYVAFDLASIDTPNGNAAARSKQALFRRRLKRLELDDQIDLRSEKTAQLMQALIDEGILTQARVDEILGR